jgi:hypothetical protein
MSQYTIEFSCKHTENRNIVGKEKDRKGKADWMAQGVCSDCYKLEKAAERQKELSAQMATAAQFTLADLEGSEKQVAWAEKIRVKMIVAVENLKTKMVDYANETELSEIESAQLELNLSVYAEVIEAIGSKVKSTWFIDNQSFERNGIKTFMNKLAPNWQSRMAAITAEEDAQIEQERQEKIAVVEQELAALETQRIESQNALTAQQQAIAPEYDALQATFDSWSDEKIEGDWDEQMKANGNRRRELDATTYQLARNKEAIESKIHENQRELTRLKA